MASSNMLDLLRLFTLEAPAWKVGAIARALHVSVATAYRYIAHLQRAGLVDSSAHGYYTLGPAFIEFDRLIRVGDPMLKVAAPRLQRLHRDLNMPCTVQLWRCYRDCVVLVHETEQDDRRGKVVSLFQGAPSRTILAALPIHILRRLFRKRATEIAAAGLGRSWSEFCAELRAIDTTGWCAARSTLAAATAVASVIRIESSVLGSISVELRGRHSQRSISAIGQRVYGVAARVAAEVNRVQRPTVRRRT